MSPPLPLQPSQFDLNLVRLYVAVHETRSVTRAAEQLSVTQPTVSYGLGRLRRFLGDPLLIRGPHGMSPSPMGEQVYRQFRDALTHIDATLQASQSFDPRRSHRVFRVAMSDLGGLCFLPPLLAHLQEKAPKANLELVQVPVRELVDDLASGKIDAAVGNLPLAHPGMRSALLFPEHYVCLLSKNHSRITDRLSVQAYVAERHVLVSSPFSVHQHIDELLAERGIERKVAVRIPQFTILPTLISQSDLLVTLPSRVANVFKTFGGLQSFNLPMPLPDFELRVHWHARHDSSPAEAWFRNQIVASLSGL